MLSCCVFFYCSPLHTRFSLLVSRSAFSTHFISTCLPRSTSTIPCVFLSYSTPRVHAAQSRTHLESTQSLHHPFPPFLHPPLNASSALKYLHGVSLSEFLPIDGNCLPFPACPSSSAREYSCGRLGASAQPGARLAGGCPPAVYTDGVYGMYFFLCVDPLMSLCVNPSISLLSGVVGVRPGAVVRGDGIHGIDDDESSVGNGLPTLDIDG